MGEMAEMMLEGVLCACCGGYIDDGGGDGIPRYCSAQCERDCGAAPKTRKPKRHHAPTAAQVPVMRRADVKWLHLAAGRPSSGYFGVQWDMSESAFLRLRKLGFVEYSQPRNPVHKARAIATDAGHAVLAKLVEGLP